MSSEQAVLEAAAKIVAAFGSHSRDEYFSYFASDATFIFYSSNTRFNARSEYEAEWASWEMGGFKVHSCASSNPLVTFHAGGAVAVFTHTVRTDLTLDGERMHTGERETIVFERQGDQWIAVHEHLSGDPTFQAE